MDGPVPLRTRRRRLLVPRRRSAARGGERRLPRWMILTATVVGMLASTTSIINALHAGLSLTIVQVAPELSYAYAPDGDTVMFSCPDTACSVDGLVPNYTGLEMACWVDTQSFDGVYRSKRWFEVATVADAVPHVAFVHSSYVQAQKKVRECATSDSDSGLPSAWRVL